MYLKEEIYYQSIHTKITDNFGTLYAIIQEIPENGPDVAHLNVVHTSAILTGTNPAESSIEWNFLKHVWSANWSPNEERQHEAILKVNHHISIFNKLPFFHIEVDVHQVKYIVCTDDLK